MKLVTIYVDDKEYDNFKREVGVGNASATLRNYIKSYSEPVTYNEKKLRKEFELVDSEYKKIKIDWENLRDQIEKIELKRKQKEIEEIEKQQKLQQKLTDLQHKTAKKDLWRNLVGR